MSTISVLQIAALVHNEGGHVLLSVHFLHTSKHPKQRQLASVGGGHAAQQSPWAVDTLEDFQTTEGLQALLQTGPGSHNCT